MRKPGRFSLFETAPILIPIPNLPEAFRAIPSYNPYNQASVSFRRELITLRRFSGIGIIPRVIIRQRIVFAVGNVKMNRCRHVDAVSGRNGTGPPLCYYRKALRTFYEYTVSLPRSLPQKAEPPDRPVFKWCSRPPCRRKFCSSPFEKDSSDRGIGGASAPGGNLWNGTD